jgi:ABC-2 type transport system permease protein
MSARSRGGPLNVVVMRLTIKSLLGRKRAIWFIALPALMLLVAGLNRWGSGGDPASTAQFAADFCLGTVLPLLCLLIGTGVVGSEIEDGSIVYLLAKPLPRRTVALSKLAVALCAAIVLGTVSVVAAVLVAGDQGWWLSNAYGTTAALSAICYTAVFFMIAILTRNAVIVGLIYALLWESVLGGYVPGVRTLSIRQWALAPAERILQGQSDLHVESAVSLATGLILLGLTTVIATVIAVQKLKTLPIRASE